MAAILSATTLWASRVSNVMSTAHENHSLIIHSPLDGPTVGLLPNGPGSLATFTAMRRAVPQCEIATQTATEDALGSWRSRRGTKPA
jgi:hypothetical protein